MTSSTCRRVSALTRGESFNTRDTVWYETPAAAATSRMLGVAKDRRVTPTSLSLPVAASKPGPGGACPGGGLRHFWRLRRAQPGRTHANIGVSFLDRRGRQNTESSQAAVRSLAITVIVPTKNGPG